MSATEDSGAHGRPSITPDTQTKMAIWRLVALVGAFVSATAWAVSWANSLANRVDQHINDNSRHLSPMETTGHGYPVGHADYAIDMLSVRASLEAMNASVAALKDRPIMLGKDCRKTSDGFICDQRR